MNNYQRKDPNSNKAASFLSYFSYLMVLVYLGLGTILLLTDLILPGFPKQQRMILGGLLVIYALYRGYTVFRRSRQQP